jgi:hypothetical protein
MILPLQVRTGYASLPRMQQWAAEIMQRAPDLVIGDHYLRRWFVIPRNMFSNQYLHWFGRSDDDRALHDHPWPNSSFILDGEYIEHTPDGAILRRAGDFVQREATSLHRIELIDARPVISLFSTGPKVRDWGFACPQGWVPWQEFTDPNDSTQVGAGCGEAV